MLVLCLWAFWTVAAAFWLAIFLRIRFIDKTFLSLDSTTTVPEPAAWPLISVIVPARNEEHDVAVCLTSLAAQRYPKLELIFVDDESTDNTLQLAREALAGCPFAQAISGRPRPSDVWVGKSWALVQGAERATGEWLLFIDSDVVHHPDTIRKAMALALQLQMDAVSIMPKIDCRSFWEKCVMPLFAALAALVEPMDRVNHPEKSGSRLSGAFILIRRTVYVAVGGHRAVANQILEDMALAEHLKQRGARAWLTYTRDLTSTRMYHNFHELWHGLVRLSFPMCGYSLANLMVAYLASFFGTLVPWITLACGAWLFAHGLWAGLPLALASLLLCASQAYMLRFVYGVLKVHYAYAWLLVVAAGLYCFAATYSAFRHLTGQGLGWKRRLYQTTRAEPGPPRRT